MSAKRTEKSTVQWEKSPTGSVGSDSYRLNIVEGGLRGGNGAGALSRREATEYMESGGIKLLLE